MTIEELKEQLQYFYNEDIGIRVYFILKDEAGMHIKLADIDNVFALPEIKDMYLNSIRAQILDKDNIQIMNLSVSDERNNVIYHYDLEAVPEDLRFISDTSLDRINHRFNFNNDSIENIKGYLVVIGDVNNKLILYKQHYAISLIKRDSSFMLHKSNQRFVRLNEDLIRLDNNFQFFSLNGELFIKDLDKLEKFFGFHDVIKREALLTIDILENEDIIENVDVLRDSLDDITFARKLTKLANDSPILGVIPVNIIISFTKNYPSLSGKFKYNEDENKIRLDTKISKNLFVKLLNDDFLKSELSNAYYDSLAKDRL